MGKNPEEDNMGSGVLGDFERVVDEAVVPADTEEPESPEECTEPAPADDSEKENP